MADRIGVKDFKNRVSAIVHEVRETQASYVITVRGEPVAELRPIASPSAEVRRQEQTAQVMREIDDLSRRIGRSWTSPAGAVELVGRQRR
jgi:prevent-host-death family protein